MKISLSQYAGFCSGVRRAYEMAMGLDMEKAKQPVFVLGSLVHNDDVNEKIRKKGIRPISREEFRTAKPGEIGTLIITAHGDDPEIFELAKKKEIEILDTTCPKVTRVQRLAQAYARRGAKIVLVGDRDHKETRGIDGWGGKESKIISSEKDFSKLDFSSEDQVVVLSQTTQDQKFFQKVCAEVKKKNPEAQIQDTICLASRHRQEEARKLAKENEAVVVIGSPQSANSKRLFEIAKGINPKSYFVEGAREIRPEWFSGLSSVAVSAGASTPDWVIAEVMETVKLF